MQTSQIPEFRRAVRYLPLTLINYWQNNPGKSPIWGQWLEGSLMHCDVTGFTAMSETLAQSGKEGAEIMAGILNQFFERMLEIANQWGGIQMKFGGDAMLLYFHGKNHAECAAACGLEMQVAMEKFNHIKINDDTCKLRMRIGIHSGKFYAISAGQDNSLLHYLLVGKEVNKAADVEPMAEPDQVVVSDETKDLLSKQCVLKKTQHKGIWWVTKTGLPKAETNEIQLSNIPPGFLRRYLMPPIADGLTAGLLGEHRRVSVVFINLFGLSELLDSKGESATLDHANRYLNIIFESMSKYRGHLITSDVCEHGDKLLIAFGAPLSVDNQEENAMRFAFEIQEKLHDSNLQLEQSIGINSGFVFTGEIGSSKRREYTTIGDTTNLAARLMSAADKGSIIVSATTAEKSEDLFDLQYLDPIRVKGKSKPINIYKLRNVKSHENLLLKLDKHSSLVGREKELNQLLNLAAKSKNGQHTLAFINGEPGIGKTHLSAELSSQLGSHGWLTMLGICQSYNLHNAFSAWIYPLQKLLNISSGDSEKAAWDKILIYFAQKCPQIITFAPLIAEILSTSAESNAVVDSLDLKSKREKRISTIIELVKSAARNKPAFLLFDNIQWMDSSSSEVLRKLLSSSQMPIFIGLASRNDSLPAELQAVFIDLVLHLSALSTRASRELISVNSELSNDDKNTIIGRAKGNPFFLKELSQSTAIDQDSLPESIHDVIMVRLDHLDNKKKILLRTASVIGQIFDLKTLDSLEHDSQDILDEKN